MPTGCERKDRIRVSLGELKMGIVIHMKWMSFLGDEELSLSEYEIMKAGSEVALSFCMETGYIIL